MEDLNTNTLFQIGTYLSEMLKINKEKLQDIKLILSVDKDYFKKIDEDIFYRTNKEKDNEFIPSENEINITFPNNQIIIKKNV